MDIWKEGKYIDFWSIPHLLSGIALTYILIIFNFNFINILVINFSLALIWELAESKIGIKEQTPNKIFDVLTGIIGAIIMIYISSFSFFRTILFFSLILSVWLTLTTWGLYSIKK